MRQVAVPASIIYGLGLAVRRTRIDRHLSQEQLALNTGVHRNYIGGVERGERSPTVETVARLAAGLDVSLSHLFELAEESLRDLGSDVPDAR